MYTIIKFRWDNCPWCKIMQPVREEAKENNIIEDLSFHNFKITDDNLHMIEKENIRSIPCIIIAKDWEELARKTWVQMPNELKEWIYSITTNPWTTTTI